MEVLYGLVLLLTFILGYGMGLVMPILVKKYVKFYKENDVKEIKEEPEKVDTEEKKDDIPYIPKDLLIEWLTGEVKPNDEQ